MLALSIENSNFAEIWLVEKSTILISPFFFLGS